MFNEGRWAKLFCFIGLSFLSCVAKAALLSLATQDQQIQAACSRVDEPAQARLCHALLVSQQAEQRQRYLHFLLQQNIFSIQTYDFLWGEYQRTTACSEISRFFLSRAAGCGATGSTHAGTSPIPRAKRTAGRVCATRIPQLTVGA